ncbi:MAG: pyrroline-5-carboxylate reductase [Verrucomicrobiota bacterium]|nr:pyrroline-5-carboxylate reductase [Verrucomicrobiota bacterium]
MPLKQTFGFLGAGRMASALAGGMVESGLIKGRQLIASDVVQVTLKSFTKSTGGRTAKSNAEVLRKADIIIIAVKPHQVIDLLNELPDQINSKHLFISIAAGVTLEQLEESLGGKVRVIRVMPNTPALVGEGASGFARGTHAKVADAKLTQQILEAVGIAVEVPERLINAVTGLSGSGPAYGFQMIEAMSDGAVAAGLPRELATPLAAQTLLGAAKMVLETGEHPGKLKDMVTSPGGTTIEGLHEMEAAGVRDGLMNAVRAATDKAANLG